MIVTPNRDTPLASPTPHPDDTSLLRQCRRIAFVIAFRHSIDPTRAGGSTARRILSHGHTGFPRDDAECREVCRIIARIAHPDKSLARDAYYCAMAEMVMDTAQRASGIVASPSTSDRGASFPFHPLPSLESAQFSGIVDTHRRAKLGRPAPVRSPATPSTANGGAAPVLTRRLPPIMPRIPSLSLLDPAEPTPPRPHTLSATDTFPGGVVQTRLRPRPAEGSSFSGADDGIDGDDSAPGLSTPPASVGGARSIPTRTATTAVGHPSAFFSHAHGDPAPAAGSHRRVRTDSGSESINLTSRIHPMIRLLTPTPIEEFMRTTIPRLASCALPVVLVV